MDIRNAPVSSMAIIVGTGPKNNPETESNTERVSNVIPGTVTHGVEIRKMPKTPMITPTPNWFKRCFSL